MWIVPMLALVFCLLGGRNDGSPLVAIRLKASRRVTAVPFLMLAAAVAVLPAANSRVGETIVAMVSSEGSGGQRPLLLATVLVAASATLLVLNGGGVPTSITLALVGASSGAGSAGGHPPMASGAAGPRDSDTFAAGGVRHLPHHLSAVPLQNPAVLDHHGLPRVPAHLHRLWQQ